MPRVISARATGRHVAHRRLRASRSRRLWVQRRVPRHSTRCVRLRRAAFARRPARPSLSEPPLTLLPRPNPLGTASRVVANPARGRVAVAPPRALFTGLVQGTAKVVSFDNVGDFARLKLEFPKGTLDGILIGASVACNGTCLTVVETEGDVACFDLIVETLRATNLGELVPGSYVNYERSARVGDEIGGHTVSGHVHAKATIVEQEDTENNRRVVFELDPKWSKYILPKGFVAVDGCSLTVGETSPGRFNVWLIPETIRQTVFQHKDVGSTVNIEIESQTQTIVDTIERVLAEKEREKMEEKMAKKERKEQEKMEKKAAKAEMSEMTKEEKKASKKDFHDDD